MGHPVAMHRFLALALACVLAACAALPPPDPQATLFARLGALCGKAYAGSLVTAEAVDADLVNKPMVMHVNHCTENEIRIPFHIRTGAETAGEAGWDRSRTWIVTRTTAGLRLKHDHRHRDGTADPVTLYGGDTIAPGTPTRQEFAVDAASIAMFRANNLARSVTNVWAIEVDSTRFAYELRRTGANARHFRVEFDLTRQVGAPPNAWGW